MTTTSQASSYEGFIQLIKKWLTQIGVNSRFFVEITEDEAVPMTARTLASGVLLYLNVPVDLILDKLMFIGLIDDVLVMIIGLVIIAPFIPEERFHYYHQKYDAVARITEYKQVIRSTLGILWDRLLQYVEKLRSHTFKKKTTEEVVQSAELREELFDETMIFVANLNLDPETLDDHVSKLPSPEKVIGLLSSGLEEAQDQQAKGEISGNHTKSAFQRMLLSATVKQEKEKDS